jgi:hypothetical protein
VAVDPAAQERAREAAERLRERLDAAMAVNPRPSVAPDSEGGEIPARRPGQQPPARQESAAPPEPGQAGRFFGGAYGGREQGASHRAHSLEAVFSRMSGGRSRALPDPRERSRGSAGLGSVFNRLR